MYLFSGYFFMSTAVADEREASAISVFMFLMHKLRAEKQKKLINKKTKLSVAN